MRLHGKHFSTNRIPNRVLTTSFSLTTLESASKTHSERLVANGCTVNLNLPGITESSFQNLLLVGVSVMLPYRWAQTRFGRDERPFPSTFSWGDVGAIYRSVGGVDDIRKKNSIYKCWIIRRAPHHPTAHAFSTTILILSRRAFASAIVSVSILHRTSECDDASMSRR
jgi:hypothetical protein